MDTFDSSGMGAPQPMQMPGMQQGGQQGFNAPMQPGTPPPQVQNPTPDDSDDGFQSKLDQAFQDANLAKKLAGSKKGKDILRDIGREIVRGYKEDEKSRSEWMKKNKEWLEMAMLVRKDKTYPWPKAANVKYPLLATAAMQFSARAYPALVPSDGNIVKVKVVQMNPPDETYQAAHRVAAHMSYQVLNCMPNWEEDMDKLLMTMAISGICFKKTYHNSLEGEHHSHLVYPENFCVNYYAKSLEKAYRKTEILHYTVNEVQERVNNDEEFLDIDLKATKPKQEEELKPSLAADSTPPAPDASTPHVFLACHTFWDLDNDGYEEPYVIVVHKDTEKVVRIIARWDQDGEKRDEKGNVIKITPVEYFTAFPFIPNPDGSIYALGFGLLLGPLNEAINTNINQLTDSGTLSNMQSGFIGKGLRIRMGEVNMQPGKWQVVNATGDDLSKSIFPMPVREPSAVLFQLLQMLIQSGNQLASIAEIFVGKMPGQNTPATTTQETIQQGMAVFTAIYKRVYRSLASEFRKLFRLNKLNPDIVEEESEIAGIDLQQSDYALPDYMIIPGADPVGDSSSVKMAKLQQVGQLLQMGTIDPMEFTKRMLEANEVPNSQQLMKQPEPPPPDPKAQLLQQQGQQAAEAHQMDMQSKAQDMNDKANASQIASARDEAKLEHEKQMQALKEAGAAQDIKNSQVQAAIDSHASARQAEIETQASAVKHVQEMNQREQSHRLDMQHADQQAKAKAKATAEKPKKGK